MTWSRKKYLNRKKAIGRNVRIRERNEARSAKKRKQYHAFMQSPAWKEQKRRVHHRDGWRCTQVESGQRCGYTKTDGPIHAHHERYHPRGIELTPDKDVRTICPVHHEFEEGKKWWRKRSHRVRMARSARTDDDRAA